MNSTALRERYLASRRRECKSNGLQCLSYLSQSEKGRGQTTQYFNFFFERVFFYGHVYIDTLREASLKYDSLTIM